MRSPGDQRADNDSFEMGSQDELMTTAGAQDDSSQPDHPADTHQDQAASSPFPQSIGGYQIEQQIGRGGMSHVFRAQATGRDQPVALKILDARFTAKSTMRQRFAREAEAIKSLSHDHIIPLYDYGDDQGTPYLAMPLIDGITVSQLIQCLRRQSLAILNVANATEDEDESTCDDEIASSDALAADCFAAASIHDSVYTNIAELIATAAEALDAAHRSGVVHRDIKPSNMMLDRNGRIWITDFGLASIDQTQPALTRTGEMIGTPHYMSPEQATADHQSIDHRTDIYSLGATLYELATLKRPYRGDRFRVLMAITSGRLAPPSLVCPDVPRPLEAIILKAMAHWPSDRYQSGAAMADDLRRYARGQVISARQPQQIDRVARWISNNPRLSIASLLTASAIGIFMITMIYREYRQMEGFNSQLKQLNTSLEQYNLQLTDTNDQLERSRNQLRQHLYIADMSAAYRAYAEHDLDAAQERLVRHIPQAHDELANAELVDEDVDLRGHEWFTLKKLCEPPDVRIFGEYPVAVRETVLIPGQAACLTSGDDGMVRRWDLPDGQMVAEYPIGDSLDALVVSPDAKLFVAGQNSPSKNNRLSVRNMDTGELVRELPAHQHTIESVAISPDGQWIVSADRYHDVVLHRMDGEFLSRHSSGSRHESISFSPDGEYIISIARHDDGTQTLQQLSLPDLTMVREWKIDFKPTTFSFSGNGQRILIADSTHAVLCGWPDGEQLLMLRNLRDRVRCVAMNHEGTILYAGCDNGMLYEWNIAKNTKLPPDEDDLAPPIRVISTGSSMITSIAITEQNEAIVTTESGAIQLWQTNHPPKTPFVLGSTTVRGVAPAKADAKDLIVRYSNGTVARLNLLERRYDPLQKVPADDKKRVAISPDGSLIVASSPNQLHVLSGDDGRLITQIDYLSRDDSTDGLVFSKDGRQLIHLLNDRFDVLTAGPNAEDWNRIHGVRFQSGSADNVVISPHDGRILVLTSELLIFDGATYNLQQTIPSEFGGYTSIQFSDDDELLILGCSDGTIELLRGSDLHRVSLLRGQDSSVLSCVLINNNRTLVSGTALELRYWDLASGRDLGTLTVRSSLQQLHYCAQEASLFTFRYHAGVQAWSARK